MSRKCPTTQLILSVLFLISLIIVHAVDAKNSVKTVKNAKKISRHVSKKVISKYPQRAGGGLASNQLLGPLAGQLMANQLMSSLKMKEIVQPIKKLTRKKMIKLLFKTIKRVNKKAKKANKSDAKLAAAAGKSSRSNGQLTGKSDRKLDNKSIEFRPTFEQTTAARIRGPPDSAAFANGLANGLRLIGTATNDRINLEINDKDAPIVAHKQLISRTNARQPAVVRRNLRKSDPQLRLVSQFAAESAGEREPRLLALESISSQVPAQVPFLAGLLNAEQPDERALNALYSNYPAHQSIFNQYLANSQSLDDNLPLSANLRPVRYPAAEQADSSKNHQNDEKNRLDDKAAYSSAYSNSYSNGYSNDKNDKIYLYKSRPFLDDKHSNGLTQNEASIGDQSIIRIHIPVNELIHYPIYVNDQLNSTNTQTLIRNFIRSQLGRLTVRSDSMRKELLSSRLLNFLARQLDIEVDRHDRRTQESLLQSGITKVLGAFVGDVVGVVFEEMLKERGDKIADNIRTKIGDIATLAINKSNVALEMTFKNLQKLLYKKAIYNKRL